MFCCLAFFSSVQSPKHSKPAQTMSAMSASMYVCSGAAAPASAPAESTAPQSEHAASFLSVADLRAMPICNFARPKRAKTTTDGTQSAAKVVKSAAVAWPTSERCAVAVDATTIARRMNAKAMPTDL